MSSPPLSILLRWHLTATAAPHRLSDHKAPVLYPPDETAPNGIPREDQVMLMANSILLLHVFTNDHASGRHGFNRWNRGFDFHNWPWFVGYVSTDGMDDAATDWR